MICTDCTSYLWMLSWRWSNNTETCCHNKILMFWRAILKHFVLLLELKHNWVSSIKIVFGLVVQRRIETVWGQRICGLSSSLQKGLGCVGQGHLKVARWYSDCSVMCRQLLGVFYVLLTVRLGIIFVNNQLDAQFFLMYVYFYSLHVSGSHVPIIRRINCINTTSSICHFV